jgi:hypothetical protein
MTKTSNLKSHLYDKNKQMMLECDNIHSKCCMRPVLLGLYNKRSKNKHDLGTLGSCTFQDIDVFLAQALTMPVSLQRCSILVAIGDIHGDLLALLAVLHLMRIVDTSAEWIADPGTAVVLTGDWMDRVGRGAKSSSTNHREEVDILQYISSLQGAGHPIQMTLGNHEVGNVWADAAFSNYARYQTSTGWGGARNKRLLWQPGGRMALYLARHCPLILQVRGFLFMHGGLPPETLRTHKTIANINTIMQRALSEADAPAPPASILDIVLDRTLSDDTMSSATCVEHTKALFNSLGLDWLTGGLVVGHTPQDGPIPDYCGGKVWRIDLALSEAFGRSLQHRPLGAIRVSFLSSSHTRVDTVHQYMNKDTIIDVTTYVNGRQGERHSYNEP